MRLWPFVVVLVGSVLGGIVYILVREPAPGTSLRVDRALQRFPVERITAALPPRFSGPLPTQVKGFQQELEKGPPLSYVRSRLLEGDEQWGQKLLSALRQTAASARSLEELWTAYGVVLGVTDDMPYGARYPEDMLLSPSFQDEGVPCTWLSKQLGGAPEPSPLLTELLWRKLVRCPGPEPEVLFARQDAPLRRVLEHKRLYGAPGLTPALEAAARRIVAQDDPALHSRALDLMPRNAGPVGRELREALWSRLSDEARAEREQRAANSERFEREQRAHPNDCRFIPVQAEGVSEEKIQLCLRKWAASNWAASARFAQSASREPSPLGFSDDLGTLRNFGSLAAMEAWARERELLPPGPLPPSDDPLSLSLIVSMVQAQRAFSVNLRSEAFPHLHDELLVTLAWRVRPALSGVAFEQLAPQHPPSELFQPRSREEYTLRAYADGQRFSVQARNSNSLEDIGAVLELLNQVLEARGSPRRFAVLDSTGSTVGVVFGPEAALWEADRLGLWRLGGGRQMLAGQERELEESLRRLIGEPPY